VSCGPPAEAGRAGGILTAVHGTPLLRVQNLHGQCISVRISFPAWQREKPFCSSNKMIHAVVFYYSEVLKHPFIPFVHPMQILEKVTSSP